VPSISSIPSHVACLVALQSGLKEKKALAVNGLVVDCGFWETSFLPIYDGRPLENLGRTSPLAGASINLFLRDYIQKNAVLVDLHGTRKSLEPSDIESFCTLTFLEETKKKILERFPFFHIFALRLIKYFCLP